MTGLANATLAQQLLNFNIAISKHTNQQQRTTNWQQAFQLLTEYLEKSTDAKKVVFIDELP